ncbi:SNF2-related, N-terminal domain [Sesbania bispinosa]|nr:SNF2-related, N-terminal domain [Sesbania bispinosa]
MVIRQPSLLRAGTLRDYQLVGLQWMLSLYNNKLNGILADEMGLGKTVQVMALIAYLMEFKGNYGPHLIIVPNAVLVNWKSELYNWLPSVACIFYVEGRIIGQNYFLKYRCQRRLLLTGTPLQNDLKELWSLLNLLLPEVFDNKKAFNDWFSKPFQKEGPTQNAEDDWLETEKKVIIIHRLHQILEPFMLRRRVEDVEGSLPPKVSIVLRCKMSPVQSAIYDWVKATGTLRLDPEDEKRRVQKNPSYQDTQKLQRTGHRVLLFSTMTKLLDILEEYLQWRRLVYRRIDGTTSLEDRESAIVDFNSPDSDCFIFLLSIRAAGRGLNLQSADTVVIYDPDPNPKNEEQAVARAHRIGQKREVKVIYMEAVVDKISSHQKEDERRSGGTVDMEDELADMADEVINAGRFDQRTTHEERRLTLETLLHDEERYQETVHDVPSLQEVNRMIARSKEEVELFDQMDDELDWIEEMTRYDHVPKWLRANTREVNAAIAALSKRPSKNTLLGGSIGMESSEVGSERRRGRPKGKKHLSYKELDDENLEYSEASSEDRNGYAHEEGEIGEFEDDGYSGADGTQPIDRDQMEDGLLCDGGYEFQRSLENPRNNQVVEEAGTSGSSSDSQRLTDSITINFLQKFGSLSALDARPSSISKRMTDELEEGKLQYLLILIWTINSLEVGFMIVMKVRRNKFYRNQRLNANVVFVNDQNTSSSKHKRTLPSRRVANTSKLHGSPKSTRLNCISAPSEDGGEHSRESWEGKPINSSGSSGHGTKMTEIIQRRCKNVISKLQRRIDKEGHQIVPLLTDLWKRIENSGYNGGSGNNLLDLRKIDQRIDRLEYNGATELVFDVQFMLKSAMHFMVFHMSLKFMVAVDVDNVIKMFI